MTCLYMPVIKLGEAESRALKEFDDHIVGNIIPIIEITRGRGLPERKDSTKKLVEKYPFGKRFDSVCKVFRDREVCLDLTSDSKLSNTEIDSLYDPSNGYINWISFLNKQKDNFSVVWPSVIFNYDDDNFEKNISHQIRSLVNQFGCVMYRCSLFDEGCYYDLDIIKKECGNCENIMIVVDCGYVQQALVDDFFNKIKARINNIQNKFKISNIVVTGTSYPNNISQIGKDDTDVFLMSMVAIHSMLIENGYSFNYSDYAGIAVRRNDDIVMANGWVPRIDVPLENKFYYYRKRKGKEGTYANAYEYVAKEHLRDARFPSHMNNWGTQAIVEAAKGRPPKVIPSFWISVRMVIHIYQQMHRLETI